MMRIISLSKKSSYALIALFFTVNICSANVRTKVSIIEFGADPTTKRNSAIAIQRAIDKVHNLGGGVVFIPRGKYLLTTTNGSFKSMIQPKSNVTIEGEGRNSILFVANSIYDFNVFSPLDTSKSHFVENVVFRNFTIDCNGENNILNRRNLSKNSGIMIRWGEKITIDNVTINNNAGNQSICIGNNVFPYSTNNINIVNCKFNNVGKVVKGNKYQTDHSAIYIQGNNCIIRNNEFINPKYSNDATAIEAHISNSIVRNNYSKNLATGLNIVAAVTNMENVTFINNKFENVDRGILFYLFPKHSMKDVRVFNNSFIQFDNLRPIIDLSVNVKKDIESLHIKGNIIENISKSSSVDTPAIYIGKVKYLIIESNIIKNSLGPAIVFANSNNGESTIIIKDNTLSNNFRSESNSRKVQIRFKTESKFKSLKIYGNLNSNGVLLDTNKIKSGFNKFYN